MGCMQFYLYKILQPMAANNATSKCSVELPSKSL